MAEGQLQFDQAGRDPESEQITLGKLLHLIELLMQANLLKARINSSGELIAVLSSTLPGVSYVNTTTGQTGVNSPTAGAPAVASTYWLPVWPGPVDQRFEMMQRSNIEFATNVRNRMTF